MVPFDTHFDPLNSPMISCQLMGGVSERTARGGGQRSNPKPISLFNPVEQQNCKQEEV